MGLRYLGESLIYDGLHRNDHGREGGSNYLLVRPESRLGQHMTLQSALLDPFVLAKTATEDL